MPYFYLLYLQVVCAVYMRVIQWEAGREKPGSLWKWPWLISAGQSARMSPRTHHTPSHCSKHIYRARFRSAVFPWPWNDLCSLQVGTSHSHLPSANDVYSPVSLAIRIFTRVKVHMANETIYSHASTGTVTLFLPQFSDKDYSVRYSAHSAVEMCARTNEGMLAPSRGTFILCTYTVGNRNLSSMACRQAYVHKVGQ